MSRAASGSVAAIRSLAVSSFCRRSARMFVAMPSPDCSNSLNVRNPRTITSRMINNDQRSPRISRETLTGQPDRRLGLGFSGTRERLTKSLAKCNSISATSGTLAEGTQLFRREQPVERCALSEGELLSGELAQPAFFQFNCGLAAAAHQQGDHPA